MPASGIMSGSRAIVQMVDGAGKANTVGIFSSVTYGVLYGVAAAPILGRFTPGTIDYVSMEPVGGSATGWRVVNKGPHALGLVPRLQDILTSPDVIFVIVDRKSGKKVATIKQIKTTGYNTTINARQLEEITVNFQGLAFEDESSGPFQEPASAAGAPPAAELPTEN